MVQIRCRVQDLETDISLSGKGGGKLFIRGPDPGGNAAIDIYGQAPA